MKSKQHLLTIQFLFLISSIMSCVSLSCSGQSKDLQQVQQLMKQEIEFWNSGDIDGYVSLYAPVDSVRMLYNGGAIYGKKDIMAFYKKYWPKEKMGQLSFTDIKLERLSKEYYFTSGYFHVIGPDGKKTNGRFSGLMKKVKGKWYIYTDHT